nr:hypothetical protein MFLOJ_08990 [Mycobacterium florentinum]
MTAIPALVSADRKLLPAMSARIGAAIVAAAATKAVVSAMNPKALVCAPTRKVVWYAIDCAVISRSRRLFGGCAKSL